MPTADTELVVSASPQTEPTTHEQASASEELFVEDELLVEEISIDGMCGVY